METNTIRKLKQTIYKHQFSLEQDRALSAFSEVSLKLAEQLLKENSDVISPSAFTTWWQANYRLYANQQMMITNLNFKGSGPDQRRSEEGEYIEITNQGPAILDLEGWSIEAGPNQKMTFKANTLIASGQTIRIYTFDIGEFSFNSHHAIWNNRGDKAKLFDENANLICQWWYGREAEQDVYISHIAFDGNDRYSEGDEYVEITNLSPAWVDISSWVLGGGHADDFVFSEGSQIAPFGSIRVYTNKLDAKTGGYSWDSKRAIWNNHAGHAYLNGLGQGTVSDYSYGK